MSHDKEMGSMQAHLEMMKDAQVEIRKDLNFVMKWQWMALGFLSALNFITDVAFLWMHGHR